MHPIIRNILAVIAGLLLGGMVNMGIIMMSGSIIPPPEGADFTTTEGLQASMHLMQPKHFLMPFLAHALGTFVSALIVAFLVTNHIMKFALGVATVSLIGGITAVMMLPAPMWFNVLDLVCAYIPMGYLAGKIALNNQKH